MGWDYENWSGTPRQWAENMATRNNYELVDYATSPGVMYLALKYPDNHRERPGVIFAAIVLTDRKAGEFNFGTKVMDETCGPFEAKAPRSFIEKLSPVEKICEPGFGKEYAERWRDDCLKYDDAKRGRTRVVASSERLF